MAPPTPAPTGHPPHTATVAGVPVDTRHWIDGTRVASPAAFTDHSPIDGTPLAGIARGTAAEARAAVAAADAAFTGGSGRTGWAATPPAERAALLHAVADGVDARAEELAAVETADNGALLRSHRRGVLPRVAHNFRYFADRLLALSHDDFDTRGHTNHVSWDPAGPAVLITPWNAPLMLSSWKIAPALAAGSTVVLKPSEWTPLTASLLADITHEAGLPPGVFNVVQGYGDEAGAALTAHPDVRRISFTGSVPTARRIAAAAAAHLVPCGFELGGKSPLLVLADADLDLAADLAVEQYDNAGQICLAATRILVEESVRDAFLGRFLDRAAKLTQGDPRDEATDIGPSIHPRHVERVDGFVRRALAAGATAVIGGARGPGPTDAPGGNYYLPTLLTDVDQDSEIVQEEVFGPVLTLQTFPDGDENEAVRLANGTRFGLAATLVAGDRERAARIGARLVAGTVWVNCFYVRDLSAPFGGARRSGIGREGGDWSFDFYCDLKNTVTAPKGWADHG
ncbi:aldehyde dehydrogenase family protein [Streptomyces sp. Je 1-369]|uniref:aldehyde dehydrogenase family protein n=1 Tax=Streptomyces sp. Je 1-369 TaxID=2966192 RepID=UPI002285D06D|nr:aldehyde dehydrogenase family protein [Streptomyces sp. Je 1-369]WAL95387.1 aldehyde dehydrogenase family protein [Streptomyces sp. Je 1-369]